MIYGILDPGWRGGIGFSLQNNREPRTCAICGATMMPVINPTAKTRIVRWHDHSRPDGDERYFAHPKCLNDVRYTQSKWPKGLTWVALVPSPEQRRQIEARKRLVALGRPAGEVEHATRWVGGKEPECISQLLDPPEVRSPKSGDRVFFGSAAAADTVVTCDDEYAVLRKPTGDLYLVQRADFARLLYVQ